MVDSDGVKQGETDDRHLRQLRLLQPPSDPSALVALAPLPMGVLLGITLAYSPWWVIAPVVGAMALFSALLTYWTIGRCEMCGTRKHSLPLPAERLRRAWWDPRSRWALRWACTTHLRQLILEMVDERAASNGARITQGIAAARDAQATGRVRHPEEE